MQGSEVLLGEHFLRRQRATTFACAANCCACLEFSRPFGARDRYMTLPLANMNASTLSSGRRSSRS